MKSRSWTEIDLKKIDHNVREIEKLMAPTKIMGIVKADAYGHGAIECARRLVRNGVDFLAVATLDEARELREAGIEQDILVLGYTHPDRFQELLDLDLVQSCISMDYARKLNDFGPVRIHVKLDTGMNRVGLVYDGSQKARDELLEVYGLDTLRHEGIFSHFSVSDDLGEDALAFTERQKELFDDALAFLKEQGIDPGVTHLQNSYGILNHGPMGYDYCRPGLLYMGVTSDDSVAVRHPLDLRPIMSLKARISMVKEIEPGQSVSYGRNFTAERPTKVASVTIGYADGLARLCSNRNLEVLVHGKKVPVIGNICMDQCMIDVTGLDCAPGDEVTIIGEDGDQKVTVDNISRLSETINNETLCRFGARAVRTWQE